MNFITVIESWLYIAGARDLLRVLRLERRGLVELLLAVRVDVHVRRAVGDQVVPVRHRVHLRLGSVQKLQTPDRMQRNKKLTTE